MSGTIISALRWCEPAKASRYIGHIDGVVRSGDKVVLWCRESSRTNKSHLADQEVALRAAAESRGAIVVDVVRHIGPGYDHDHGDAPCWWAAVARAADVAENHGAKLLATETDRFIRDPACFISPKSQPRESDFRRLAAAADGVSLATLAAPDAPPSEARSRQTKRGQAATGRKGGRPPGTPGYKKAAAVEVVAAGPGSARRRRIVERNRRGNGLAAVDRRPLGAALNALSHFLQHQRLRKCVWRRKSPGLREFARPGTNPQTVSYASRSNQAATRAATICIGSMGTAGARGSWFAYHWHDAAAMV